LLILIKHFCKFNCSWHYSYWAYYVKRQKRKSEFAEWHKRFWFVTFTYISGVTLLLWTTSFVKRKKWSVWPDWKICMLFQPKSFPHFNIESTNWKSMITGLYENLFFGKCRLTKCYKTIKSNHRCKNLNKGVQDKNYFQLRNLNLAENFKRNKKRNISKGVK
jgi:hypothetical protein